MEKKVYFLPEIDLWGWKRPMWVETPEGERVRVALPLTIRGVTKPYLPQGREVEDLAPGEICYLRTNVCLPCLPQGMGGWHEWKIPLQKEGERFIFRGNMEERNIVRRLFGWHRDPDAIFCVKELGRWYGLELYPFPLEEEGEP